MKLSKMSTTHLASASQPQLKALIYTISQYPLHARHALEELIKKEYTGCLYLWIVDALKSQNLLLQEIIALGDTHGRNELLRIVRSFYPSYTGHFGEPINTVWGHPFLPENWKE